MKLDDIIFLNSEYPIIKHTVSPSKVTLSLLTSLFYLSDFAEELNEIINKYSNFEPHDISELDTNFENVLAWYKLIRDDFDPIMLQFKLPEVYRFRFFLLVHFHVFIDIPEDEEPEINYLENIGEIEHFIEGAEERLQRASALIFSSICTKKEIINWINSNWEYIQKEMIIGLPTRPKSGKVYKNVSIAQEAYELRKQNMSYEEISNILINKYPNNNTAWDPQLLKTIVSRHIHRLKKISQKYPALED